MSAVSPFIKAVLTAVLVAVTNRLAEPVIAGFTLHSHVYTSKKTVIAMTATRAIRASFSLAIVRYSLSTFVLGRGIDELLRGDGNQYPGVAINCIH
jgi:hypothetical protein